MAALDLRPMQVQMPLPLVSMWSGQTTSLWWFTMTMPPTFWNWRKLPSAFTLNAWQPMVWSSTLMRARVNFSSCSEGLARGPYGVTFLDSLTQPLWSLPRASTPSKWGWLTSTNIWGISYMPMVTYFLNFVFESGQPIRLFNNIAGQSTTTATLAMPTGSKSSRPASSLWPIGTPLRPSEERYYFGALKRLIRRFLLPKFTLDEMLTWTDQRTFMEAGLLPPKLHIRLCRLGYFATLIRHGPAPLWALLATDRLWLDQILVDMPWFTTHCHSRVYRPPFLSSDGPVYWEHLIKEHNGTWKGLLKKARQHAFLQSKIHTRADLFERKIAAILADYNPMLAPRDPAASLCPDAPQPTVCIPCKRSFVSKAAWAIHAFKVHGRRAAARYIADQCSCDICHHSFLNEHRLYLHLRYSKPCFDALRARGVQINPLPGRGSREWNQATQFTLCPYQQAQGPDPDPGHLPAWDKIALAPHECDLLENLILLETLDFEPYLQPSTDETTWSAIRDCLQQAPVSLEEMRTVLLTWRSFLRAQQRPGQRLVPMNTHCWIRGINMALDRLTYSWLCPDIVYNHSQPVLTTWGHWLAGLCRCGCPLTWPGHNSTCVFALL